MAVKIPIKMKEDVPVRNMEELKQYFDPEKLLVHYRDGKLQTWLRDRYYEDELDAVNALDGDASDLLKKLCAVFGEEYSGGEEIDLDAIQRRNERIAKLKQYTADEEIIANVDSVAFNQEELAELYDRGVEKIYLCEGNFRIPESKAMLCYQHEGLGATVTGLPQKEQAHSSSIGNETSSYDNQVRSRFEIVDRIICQYDGSEAHFNSNIIETQSYFVTKDRNQEDHSRWFFRVDKITGERTAIIKSGLLQGINSDRWLVYEDNLILPSDYEYKVPMLVNLRTLEMIKIPVDYNAGIHSRGAFQNPYFVASSYDGIQVLDLRTMQSHFVLDCDRNKLKPDAVWVSDNLLLMVCGVGEDYALERYAYLLVYDLEKRKEIDRVSLGISLVERGCDWLVGRDGKLFLILNPGLSDDKRIIIYQIDQANLKKGAKEVISFTVPDSLSYTYKIGQDGKVVFVNENRQLCLLHLGENQIIKLADDCAKEETYQTGLLFKKNHSHFSVNQFVVLKEFVYFESDNRIYRIDLENYSLSEVVGARVSE